MLLSNPATYDTRPLKEAKSLAHNGYRVTILAWDREGGSPRRSSSPNLEIKRLKFRAPYGQSLMTLLSFTVFYVWCFFNSLTTFSQAVHCHDVDTLPLGIILKVSRRCTWLVYDMHDHPGVYLDKFPRSKTLIGLAFTFARRYADRVVVVNDAFVKYLADRGFKKEKLAVVMNALETVAEKPRLRGKGIFRIFYYGTLEGEWIYNLIKAVESLSGVLLVLAGKGDLVPWITNSKENWVNMSYLGWVSLSEIDRVTQETDLIPTIHLPIKTNNVLATPEKFFTSIAVGIPILASEGTYMATLIREYKFGLVVDATSSISIREGLRILIDDKRLYDRLARNGIKIAREMFNWEVMEKRLLSVYSCSKTPA
jgi:glycosyltransferase involved in cell wall biosynthesis